LQYRERTQDREVFHAIGVRCWTTRGNEGKNNHKSIIGILPRRTNPLSGSVRDQTNEITTHIYNDIYSVCLHNLVCMSDDPLAT
jgi:hypothetical protein